MKIERKKRQERQKKVQTLGFGTIRPKESVGNIRFVGVARGRIEGGCRRRKGGGVSEVGENTGISLSLLTVMLSGEEDVIIGEAGGVIKVT